MDDVTFKAVKEKDSPEYWVAMKGGQVIAKSMSEQGVRSMVLVMENKKKKEVPTPNVQGKR